jgi:deoxyribonuclease-4
MAGGLLGAAREAAGYGADTFMIYTGAPQNTVRKPVDRLKIPEGLAFMAENGLSDIVVHAPYIINLASPKPDTFHLAVSFLRKEIERTRAVGSGYLVLHPGSFTDRDAEFGLNRIIEGLNAALTDDEPPIICLETMAGKGSELGRTFAELWAIINGAERGGRLGVCFDTCHAHDAGYDVAGDFDGVMAEFDAVVGLERLKVFHLNGSLNPRGARKDRHANLGAGPDNPKGTDKLGKEAVWRAARSRYAEGRPLILETPWPTADRNYYKEEIAYLRGDDPAARIDTVSD